MIEAPAYFQANSYATLADIVETINGGGSAMSSAAEIAGWYAFSAAVEGSDDSSIDADTLDAHLDFLREAGANFDNPAALAQAGAYLAAERAERAAE
ncbi:MAG: hypothetical protein BGO66_03015 [Alicycliphilus sp. 69-12]|nr:MAG: hypothetical protein BGO66_03015 [Alicycliphilus sp. 69-12]